jgi:hypothetical protein
MSDFDGLDLRAVESELEDGEGGVDRIVLGVLDGSTPDEEWIETVAGGAALVLDVDGEINELAAGFAREVREGGVELVHFRGFLLVTPAGVSVDTDRL